MTALTQSSATTVLATLADAIEGGNAYRGSGTKFNGIPGAYSHDEAHGLTVTATSVGAPYVTLDDDAIVFEDNAGASATVLQPRDAVRITHADTAPWFLVRSDGQARKITAIEGPEVVNVGEPPGTNHTLYSFTVSPAFDAVPANGTVFSLAEGFKRVRDNTDPTKDDGAARHRQFDLSMEQDQRQPWYGNGVAQYRAVVTLRLWFSKRARYRTDRDQALEGARRLHEALSAPEHRDGTYLQLLDGTTGGPRVSDETSTGLVITDTLAATYRVGVTFT